MKILELNGTKNSLFSFHEAGSENSIHFESRFIHTVSIQKLFLRFLPEFLSHSLIFKIFCRVMDRIAKYFRKASAKRFLKNADFEVVIFHFGWSFDEFYPYYNLLQDKKIIISFHGSDVTFYPEISKNYVERLKKISASNNVLFSANSLFLKGELMKLGINAKKISLLYNTYDEKNFPIINSKDFNKTFLKVINISRMVNWKGQEYLVRGFASFLKGYQGSLTLIGEGECLNKLKRLVEELGIEKSVNFLGKVDHDQIRMILEQHHVYVQPSIVDEKTGQCETFGVVLLEAISAGLPVIVTLTGGMPEVVEDKRFLDQFYFYVPPSDSKAITDKLSYICGDNYNFLENRAYAHSKLSFFSNDNYYRCLNSMIERLGEA